MDLARLHAFLYWMQLFLPAALALVLFRRGLFRTYYHFCVYLLAQFTFDLILKVLPNGTALYGATWGVFLVISWVLLLVAILEIYNYVVAAHPGIANLGRRALLWAIVISVGLSGLLLLMEHGTEGSRWPWLETIFVTYRFVMSSLLLVILVMAVFIAWFPVSLSRNTVLHFALFGVLTFGKGTSILLRNFFGAAVNRDVGTALFGVTTLCMLLWLFALTSAGQRKMVRVGHRWNPADEERLLAQLDAINNALLRSAKR